jgi:hypothetical protein
MEIVIFDVETGPLADGELSALLPPFDPAEVKTGNLKDPAKIAEKIAEAAANHRRDFFERAALDPLTGRVVAIGLQVYQSVPGGDAFDGDATTVILGAADEAALLTSFWAAVRGDHGRLNPLIGFNICLFDLPFLMRRSWKHGVKVPFGIRRGRYWGDQVVDLRDAWQLGDRQARGSLDSIAKHLGVGAKNGDGKAFAELWRSDRKQAEAYLRNDLELTARVAKALGVVV